MNAMLSFGWDNIRRLQNVGIYQRFPIWHDGVPFNCGKGRFKSSKGRLSWWCLPALALHSARWWVLRNAARLTKALRLETTAGQLNVWRHEAKRSKCLYDFFKGGPGRSFPPDWPNLTVIDVYPWKPSSQSAKSNRKSSEGAWLSFSPP